MELQTTKEKIIQLVEESDSEALLNEVYKILELGAHTSFELTEAEMDELDEMERKFDAGEMRTSSWEEIRNRLMSKLKK